MSKLVPANWTESLDELRHDLKSTVDKWISKLKGGQNETLEETSLNSALSARNFERLLSQGGPHLDVEETEDEIRVTAEIPGLKKDDINVDINNQYLRIYGQKKGQHEEKRGHFYYSERRFGGFSRTIPLPCEVDENKIKAKYKDGVLQLRLPKSENAKSRRIEILNE